MFLKEYCSNVISTLDRALALSILHSNLSGRSCEVLLNSGHFIKVKCIFDMLLQMSYLALQVLKIPVKQCSIAETSNAKSNSWFIK